MAMCTLINNRNSLLCFQGRSRHTYHIAPKCSVEAEDADIKDLAMVNKLVSKGVLTVLMKDEVKPGQRMKKADVVKEKADSKEDADIKQSDAKKQTTRAKSKD